MIPVRLPTFNPKTPVLNDDGVLFADFWSKWFGTLPRLVGNVQTGLDELLALIEILRGDVVIINTRLGDIDFHLAGIDIQIAAILTSINALTARVTATETSIIAINAHLAVIDAQIADLYVFYRVKFGTYNAAPAYGAGDYGLFYYVTAPYNHLVVWTGNAWTFCDGGNGRVEEHPTDPGVGWQLCDGTVTDKLTVGATLGVSAFTTPNEGDDTIHKSGTYDGVVNPAVAPTIGGDTGVPSATVDVQAGTGTLVAGDLHTHPSGTIVAGTDGEQKNLKIRRYFRR